MNLLDIPPPVLMVAILIFWLAVWKVIELVVPPYSPDKEFESVLEKLPPPVQRNIREGMKNGNSYSWEMFLKGYEVNRPRSYLEPRKE